MATPSSSSSRWRRASKSARATKIDILYSGTHSSRAWYDCWRTMTMTRVTFKSECEEFSSNLTKAGAEFQGFQCSSVAGLPGTEIEMISAGEESICATLGTSAKTNARDLAMCMRVEPAHGPTGSMASGTGRKQMGFRPSYCARALFHVALGC